jgi:hypothetical protein
MKKVIQVIPREDFKVYVYFEDGKVKLYDMKNLIGKGVFAPLSDLKIFKEKCTVMNFTLAWDLSGKRDEYDCLDIDPCSIYENGEDVRDPLVEN